jgi:hypothetical protein
MSGIYCSVDSVRISEASEQVWHTPEEVCLTFRCAAL